MECNMTKENSFLVETKIVKNHKYQLEMYGTYLKKIIKTLPKNLKENLKKNWDFPDRNSHFITYVLGCLYVHGFENL